MTVVPSGPEGHVFGRGDYGMEYAHDIVDLIEDTNCSRGCTNGNPTDPVASGGECRILLRIYSEEPVPEIDPRQDGPVCTVRQPLEGDGLWRG